MYVTIADITGNHDFDLAIGVLLAIALLAIIFGARPWR